MQIRIVLSLSVILLVAAGCKKHGPTFQFSGVVMHATMMAPIANAKVVLYVGTGPLYSLDKKLETTTDAKGYYYFGVRENNLLPFHMVEVVHDDLVRSYLRTPALGYYDTVWLDKPAYLRLIMKSAKSPMPASFTLSWYFTNSKVPVDSAGFPTKNDNRDSRYYINAPGIDTVLRTFAYNDYDRLTVCLLETHGGNADPNPDTLVKKVVSLPQQPLSTTETIIEW